MTPFPYTRYVAGIPEELNWMPNAATLTTYAYMQNGIHTPLVSMYMLKVTVTLCLGLFRARFRYLPCKQVCKTHAQQAKQLLFVSAPITQACLVTSRLHYEGGDSEV